jgi:hypothetical protein
MFRPCDLEEWRSQCLAQQKPRSGGAGRGFIAISLLLREQFDLHFQAVIAPAEVIEGKAVAI